MVIVSKLLSLHGDSLFRNSFYLMLATAVVSGFGFIFWLLTAHLFATEEIGLATALISTMNLISILSLLGFNTVYIRFLSKSTQLNEEINTGMILVGFVAIIFGSIFVTFVDTFSPKLHFIQTPGVALAFVLFCALAALNVLSDSIFLAFRKTQYTLINSTIYSMLKIVFPFAFIGFGAVGIFAAAASAQAVGLFLGLFVIMRKFGYRPQFIINSEVIKRTWKYSTVNYTAAVFNLLPISVLPLIITNHLGADSTAYFYISMMIGNLLYVIPWSAARSLFAEGSHTEEEIIDHVKKAILINASLLLPAILVVIVFGNLVLKTFGENYAHDGVHFLWLVALAGVPIAINSTFGALLQVKKDPRSLVITNIFYGIALIGLSYVLLPFGLNGIGYAWILGNCTAALVNGISYFWADRFFARLESGTYVPRLVIALKARSFFQYIKNGFTRKIVLFYPEKPRWYHVSYAIMHTLGYRITNDPQDKFDVAISFEDITIKHEDATLAHLRATTTLINGNCMDISKKRVDLLFSEVFGYSSIIDPRTHVGICVKKSDMNATHDGQIINCPTEPQEGFIYQKLIDNTQGNGMAMDMRVIVYKNTIPFVIYRDHDIEDRFDKTVSIQIVSKEDGFSPDEIKKILSFCMKFGIDYGELDVLRDKGDGRIYIVDANLTCGGPMSGKNLTKKEYWKFISDHASNFETTFMK